ncbi:MAG TPA: ankyrin repeat domain-containing protein, partial [Armatimonadota bacterium]|nr:ankyrin repeat domain-containing protein [Armatimonadota bacterium]
ALALIDAGADVNAEGGLPVLLAARVWDAEVLRRLLARGGDANAVDKEGMSALAWAAQHGRNECVKILLAQGAQVDHREKHGATPLVLAVRDRHTETVRLLLAAGADPNLPDTSLLGRMENEGQKEIARLLIEHGGRR